jgi:hypothetical protein
VSLPEYGRPERSYYEPAAICRRGHVVTSGVEEGEEIAARCSECGAEVLTACPECGHRIRGYHFIPGVAHGEYDRPSFCDRCGAPHPWVGRTERLYELENIMEREDALDEATKMWLRERIQALHEIDAMDTTAQRTAWQEIKDHAQPLWGNPMAQKLIGGLITEGVKAALR